MFASIRTRLAARIRKVFVTREEGASLVEYALLVALIAVVCMATIALLGGAINTQFNKVVTELGGS
jgi:pilus assembly protein Flp/PilA